MKIAILVMVAALAMGCATLDRIGPACRVLLAEDICDTVDVISDIVEDTQGVIDTVTGDEEQEVGDVTPGS